MADQILRRDKNSTTDRTGKALWLQLAGQATPSTYDDEFILPDDFLAPEQADIATNTGNISTLTTRVTTLESLINKVHRASDNTAFQETQPEDSMIKEIGFLALSGSPVVKVGTTLGGDDIISERSASPDGTIIDKMDYQLADRTLYFSVTGGTVATTIIYRTNYFEQ